MNVFLLYPDREWTAPEFYYDYRNITQDLGLNVLFSIASKAIELEGDKVKRVLDSDLVIRDVMQKVILTPLKTAEEIYYRQELVRDSIAGEEKLEAIYGDVSYMLEEWNKIGRRLSGSRSGLSREEKLRIRIQELVLFIECLDRIKEILGDMINPSSGRAADSRGFKRLYAALCESYSEERSRELKEIRDRVIFYAEDYASQTIRNKPRVTMTCKLGENGRLDGFEVLDVNTIGQKYRNPKSLAARIQRLIDSSRPSSIECGSDTAILVQTGYIEYDVVKNLMEKCEPFMHEFEDFFDRLRFQIAFYRGAALLTHHLSRYNLSYCYPKVTEKENLRFNSLKEFIMCMQQQVTPIGNTCFMDNRNLIIVTGANQGGKSTFLRSIGIAQVMMQCGLPAVADNFESGIFTHLFMHFTRREDSQMNSGRLDEELGRMNQIIEHLGDDSLVLLNESFATTTERDGSIIAYDIIRALVEHGVKVITVTHLLSFAQRMFAQTRGGKAAASDGLPFNVEFLTAERTPDGKRTYHMIQNVPELTSFGLDLYDMIIGKQ